VFFKLRYLLVTNYFYVSQLHRRCNKVDEERIELCLQNAMLLVSNILARKLHSSISVVSKIVVLIFIVVYLS